MIAVFSGVARAHCASASLLVVSRQYPALVNSAMRLAAIGGSAMRTIGPATKTD